MQNDLAFDKYSKLKHCKAIALNSIDARVRGSFLCEGENQFVETRNKAKASPRGTGSQSLGTRSLVERASIILVIKNIKVLNNYLIPYLKDMKFRTKKGLDFLYFTDICRAVYKGSHRSEEIRSLILKLSYNMNNFRLSTFKGKIEYITLEERHKIVNAVPYIEYLEDGRVRHLDNSIEILLSGCVYEIKKPDGDTILLETLKQVASTVNVGYRTLKTRIERQELKEWVEIKGYKIKRIGVFQ